VVLRSTYCTPFRLTTQTKSLMGRVEGSIHEAKKVSFDTDIMISFSHLLLLFVIDVVYCVVARVFLMFLFSC